MQDLLVEYELLRNEIINNSKLVAQVFIANTTVTSALVGYGLQHGGGAVFLSPLVILVPSLFFIASQLESTTTISQYLRVILEPKIKIGWQTRWYNLRKLDLLPVKRKYVPAVSGLYGLLCILCLILAGATWPFSTASYLLALIMCVVPLGFAVVAIHRAFSSQLRDAIASAWRQLESEKPSTGAAVAHIDVAPESIS
jgi:hypothetical protein